MPYINPAQHESHEMSHEEMKRVLCEHLDDICTYLSAGTHWNMRAANASRKLAIRGLGRWHDCCAKSMFCELEHLAKVVGDKLGYMPKIDIQLVAKAEMFDMNNINDFKAHFKMWMDMQHELAECLNHAIHKARTVDVQIYEKLCCMANMVQNEKMRIRMTYDSFDFAGWNAHDISVKSKWIHHYFEHEHIEGEDVNFNLG